ncbi:hypothetical protein [Trebonia sp.]|uniref:hypothetical protein n=1 Tax=Trebonia sp. TaxID=2767075 RepID=UPI003BB17EA6
MPSLPRVPPVAARAPLSRISGTNPCSAPLRPRLGARSVTAPRPFAGSARRRPRRRQITSAIAPLPALTTVIDPPSPLTAIVEPPRGPLATIVKLPHRSPATVIEPPDGPVAAVVELPGRPVRRPVLRT